MRWLLPGLVFLLVACGNGANPLANTEWRLVALGNADAPSEEVVGDITAKFTTATDMTGWMGCNSYAARYSARGSELRLDDLMWTEAGCPSQALFLQEQRMQDLLATVERYEVSGEQLKLHSDGGQVLVFRRVWGEQAVRVGAPRQCYVRAGVRLRFEARVWLRRTGRHSPQYS